MICSKCGKEIINDAKICSYCKEPVWSSKQAYSNMQSDSNQQYYSNQTSNNQQYHNMKLKPDNKFNLVAGLFTWMWALCKGMWDLFLFDILMRLVCVLLTVVGIGIGFFFIYNIAMIVIIGRNANYYYRLKVAHGIPMHKAIQDPDLRRI